METFILSEEDNKIACTAYVTIALLEHHNIYNGSIVENALSCLRKSVDSVKSLHTQALLAYAFTLSGDSELRQQTLEKVEQSIVKNGAEVWLTPGFGEEKDKFPKGLVLKPRLGLGPHYNCPPLEKAALDTTIALQAMAKYAKVIYRKKGDLTITIRSKSGFEKIVHVDKDNSLSVQKVNLPEIPGEYTVSATGKGFVYFQSHLHCNVLPKESEKGYFSFNVSTEPSHWTHASKKEFNIHVDVGYLGRRENTNMALIIVTMVSGYVPDRESVNKLRINPLVERTEILPENVTIYLKKISHETVSLDFSVEQEALVENLQPATAVVLDYYDPDEHTVVEYHAPWNSVVAHCALSPTEREDCGFARITKEQCEQKGCCVDSSIHETKWCFFHVHCSAVHRQSSDLGFTSPKKIK
ncbi:unnamed protein product [Ranitomeya imitator]|uniref:P-type domain-containing protein n=1 Tax=Ranitomeya imitator TaxID=111125 RepID=A0ABN9MIG1_9NEOB|nr:unnamed protein product [Ranitomeya imitator]